MDGGNASLAPPLRIQFEVPEGVIVPQTPQVMFELVDLQNREPLSNLKKVQIVHKMSSGNGDAKDTGKNSQTPLVGAL